MQQSISKMHLKVIDEETLTVPSGTFQTWKVSLNYENDDQGKFFIWVVKDDDRRVVKRRAEFGNSVIEGILTRIE